MIRKGVTLKYFNGLGNYKKVLEGGVMECSINKYRSLYKSNHTLAQAKKILLKMVLKFIELMK